MYIIKYLPRWVKGKLVPIFNVTRGARRGHFGGVWTRTRSVVQRHVLFLRRFTYFAVQFRGLPVHILFRVQKFMWYLKGGKIISLNKVNVVKKFSFSLRAEVEEWNWVYLQCVFKGVQANENRSLVGWVWMATERPRIGRDLWESVIPYETLLKYFKKDWKRHSTSTRFSLKLESQEKSAKFVVFNLYIIYRARSTRREVSRKKLCHHQAFIFTELFVIVLSANFSCFFGKK